MSANPFDLSGKVAIVTGSTKGIGRAMASGLAQAGAHVVVSSRKQELCEKVASEIEEDTQQERLRYDASRCKQQRGNQHGGSEHAVGE